MHVFDTLVNPDVYPRYLITGGMHDWAGSMGIASFTPELWNGDESDTEANLKAIKAVLAEAAARLPLPEDSDGQRGCRAGCVRALLAKPRGSGTIGITAGADRAA